MDTPNNANIRPRRAAKFSSGTASNSGVLTVRMNWIQLQPSAISLRLLHHQRDSRARAPLKRPAALTTKDPRTPAILKLFLGLVGSEQATDTDKYHRDQESVDVALAAVAERVLSAGLR